MRDLRVAAAQIESRPGDLAANLATVERWARAAAAQGAELVAFPECCLTGYWWLRRLDRTALARLAEPVPDGPSSQAVRRLAEELGLTIGVGLVEADGDALFNTYLVAMPDGTAARHRKIHCFINAAMASGDSFTVFDTPHGCRVGVLICYDNNIQENVRATTLLGAEVLLAPHQTGGCGSIDPHTMGLVDPARWAARDADPGAIEAELRGPKGREWLLRWLPARAHDNGMFVVFSNGIGLDDDEIRTGNAMVLDPYGRILAETCRAGEDLVTAELDAGLLANCTGRRWNSTRRPELYGLLTERRADLVDTRDSLLREKGPGLAAQTGPAAVPDDGSNL